MSSFSNLPYETLSKIFHGMTQGDLVQCQRVCRSWRLPARDLLLNYIHLRENSNIEKLLSVMQDTPLYLGNVKQLILGYNARITDEQAERLFGGIAGVVKEIQIVDEDSAISLSQTSVLSTTMCSKITARLGRTVYRSLIEQLRRSVTNICWQRGFTLKFLSNFHQLQEIDIRQTSKFCNFESWLPLFKQHSHLRSIQGSLIVDDSKDVLDSFTLKMSDQEQSLVLSRLSRLETLHIWARKLYLNNFRFINKYLVGVKNLKLVCYSSESWTDSQVDVFSNELLDFTDSMTTCDIDVVIDRTKFSCCLHPIFQKVFLQPAQCTNKALSLNLIEPRYCTRVAIKSIKMSNSQFQRSVDLHLAIDDLQAFLKHIQTTEIQIDKLSWGAVHCNELGTANFSMLRGLLDALHSVTKVSLELPRGGRKKFFDRNQKSQYDQVKYLELSSSKTNGMTIRRIFHEQLKQKYIWDDIISMFPEIKCLKLNYFSGVWKAKLNEFHISLKNITLERLHLDVTPVFTKSINPYTHFVLDIKTHARHCFYKVSFIYLQVTSVNEAMVETLSKQGCIRVRIHALDLEYINLYLRSRLQYYYLQYYYLDEECMNEVWEAKISLI